MIQLLVQNLEMFEKSWGMRQWIGVGTFKVAMLLLWSSRAGVIYAATPGNSAAIYFKGTVQLLLHYTCHVDNVDHNYLSLSI